MKLIKFDIGFLGENSYLYIDGGAKKAAVIDPGGDAERIKKAINEEGCAVACVLLTHGHYDHTGAASALRDATGAPVLAHEAEKAVLENPRVSMSAAPVMADRWLADGDIVTVGGLKLRVIHTPGHTAGSSCFYDEENGILFSGDTLFHRSVGRHDLPTGSGTELAASIRTKLFALPDETRVLPGHMGETTVGQEKAHNPFVN